MTLVASGDEAAFNELHRRWYPALHRVIARGIGDPHLAEEVAQDVLMRVYEAAGRFDSSRPFKAWLWTIAQRLVFNELRDRARRLKREQA